MFAGTWSGISRRRKRSTLQEQINLPERVSESEEVVQEDVAEIVQDDVVIDDAEEDFNEPFSSSSNSPVNVDDVNEDPDYIGPIMRKTLIDFISTEMVAAMDSCKISNPCAMRLLAPTLKVP